MHLQAGGGRGHEGQPVHVLHVGGQHGSGQGEAGGPLPADRVAAGDGGERMGQVVHAHARASAARKVSSTAHPSSNTATGTRGSGASRVMIGGPTRQVSQTIARTRRKRAQPAPPPWPSQYSDTSSAGITRTATSCSWR